MTIRSVGKNVLSYLTNFNGGLRKSESPVSILSRELQHPNHGFRFEEIQFVWHGKNETEGWRSPIRTYEYKTEEGNSNCKIHFMTCILWFYSFCIAAWRWITDKSVFLDHGCIRGTTQRQTRLRSMDFRWYHFGQKYVFTQKYADILLNVTECS